MDFHSAFTADFKIGRLYWRSPPKNHAQRRGDEAGFINIGKGNNKNYWQIRCFGRTFKRGRIIFLMAYGHWPSPVLDHINGDSLDDRLSNLRECNFSQNVMNSRARTRSHNLPRGVYEQKPGRFMARITMRGLTQSLGTFDTIQLAESAYWAARKDLFDEYA